MKKAIAVLGWTLFGLFLLLGLVAWGTLPSRIEVNFRQESPASPEAAPGSHLAGVVLDLEERVEELEGTLDIVVQELARVSEGQRQAGDLAGRNRDALQENLVQVGALARQSEVLKDLLTAIVAREGAGKPAESTETASISIPETVAFAEAPSPPASTDPAEAADSNEGGEGGRREAIGFGDLLARKRWSLWEESTSFEVLGESSLASFDGTSSVHDFTGSTRKVSGYLRFNFADPAREAQAEIVVDATSLDTQNEDRDEEMHHEYLESAKHPRMLFRLNGVRDVDATADGTSLQAVAKGVFEIHGREQEVELPVTVKKLPGRRILIEASCPLRMSSFGIEPPTALAGIIKTSDEVVARVRIEAQAVRP